MAIKKQSIIFCEEITQIRINKRTFINKKKKKHHLQIVLALSKF